MTWLTVMEYLLLVVSTFRVPLVEQELFLLPEHMSSPPVFSGVRVTRSLVLRVCFVDRCLFFCTFSFGHCVVCSSSIYRFWLPLWYLQTLHIDDVYTNTISIDNLHLITSQWTSYYSYYGYNLMCCNVNKFESLMNVCCALCI